MHVRFTILAALGLAAASPAAGQWTNRYPKIQGMSHHVYLEGYELPSLTIGPIDPAVAPDGRRIAFASRGWLWIMDLDSGVARRVTSGAGIDARPAWSPDGNRLAFVRDDTRETAIVELDLASGRERVLVDERAIDLDPSYAPDGTSLYYASAVNGDLDLWRLDLGSGAKTRITTASGSQELQPVVLADGKRIAYLAKGAGNDVRVRDLATGVERTLLSGPILSMTRLAAGPDGRTLAVTWPDPDGRDWSLQLVPVDGNPYPIQLTEGHGMPLTPAWHPNGRSVYYAEADREQRMVLYRAASDGGSVEPVPVNSWDWGRPTGRVRITTRIGATAVAARLSVTDANGHPLVPDRGQPRFDGQNGVVFFYSEGTVELEAPSGPIRVEAVQGLATPVASGTATVSAGTAAAVDISLTPIWDARAAGWLAGEHHFHLNYGGPYRLPPEVLAPMARAEALDVLTPLLANLHTRFEDQPLFRWSAVDGWPAIAWGQEVRSHFLGHLGLIGTEELFWPWIWGPGYEIHGRDDRANAEPLAFGRRLGGISSYVHPISVREPFSEAGKARIPVELIADGVLGLFDTIELVCLWSDELGSMDVWYRLLNFGSPIALSAGTDVMNNFYRTMAVGTTRVYVRSDPAAGYRGYLAGLAAGRSFATNGPILEFTVDGQDPGAILARGGREVGYELRVHSVAAVDSIDVVVNGAPVARLGPLPAGGSKRFSGRIRIPAGGWVAARALGGPTRSWPAMDSYAFGHTSPIWIGQRGSTMPATRQAAAADLLTAFDVALGRLRQSYQGTPIPRLEAQFAKARAALLP